jgi:hypothetical protein
LKIALFWGITLSMLLGPGHTKETGNRNFRELLSHWVEQVELNGAAQTEETATQIAEEWDTQLPGNWASQSSHSCVAA